MFMSLKTFSASLFMANPQPDCTFPLTLCTAWGAPDLQCYSPWESKGSCVCEGPGPGGGCSNRPASKLRRRLDLGRALLHAAVKTPAPRGIVFLSEEGLFDKAG
ncbi:hypothetical protein KIL84_016131 [Mauremys mutica]|uniref:Uncharacterized protein n=1 Tax=Mauremys mutica TaxID=74926 RepID=A0A9D3WN23_9SAUR|nr:hypothetical protein KIL84_016131 [Mauremys mutica]